MLKLINSTIKTKDNKVVQLLNNLPYDFYLSGDRYFGNPDNSLDWDFFAENNDEMINTLIRLGFVKLPLNETTIYSLKNVRVQIVDNAANSAYSQELIYQQYYSFSINDRLSLDSENTKIKKLMDVHLARR